MLRSAHGRTGAIPVGGFKILWHDPTAGHDRSQLFDTQEKVVDATLTLNDGVWTWVVSPTRCFATFSDGGQTQMARHQLCEDSVTW